MRYLLELMCISLTGGPPRLRKRLWLYPSHIRSHTPACWVVVHNRGGRVLIKPNPRRASSLCSPTPADHLSQECRNLLSQNSSNRPPHSALRGTADLVTQITVKKKEGKKKNIPTSLSGKQNKRIKSSKNKWSWGVGGWGQFFTDSNTPSSSPSFV